jgi:hypothetical protein
METGRSDSKVLDWKCCFHDLVIGYNLRHETEPPPVTRYAQIYQVWLGSVYHAILRLPDLESRFYFMSSLSLLGDQNK